ncbi:hypothetical protein PJN36_21810 [Mycobacterium kansasii]|uniref:hypothetical protein n=1 Tax=Mycobacterium kansasii TaxID=1768 RepID=UPI001145F9A6|nr:hypothetical protein [Mycobacterium kansasii]MXO40148.1 hypothetical protein [Mycobacterium kansasii]
MLTGGREPTLALARRRRNYLRHLRLWREEGLRRRVHSHRKWAGGPSASEVVANARRCCGPWISSSMPTSKVSPSRSRQLLDEHTGESLQRSITAERVIEEPRRCFAAAGGLSPCCAWTTGQS